MSVFITRCGLGIIFIFILAAGSPADGGIGCPGNKDYKFTYDSKTVSPWNNVTFRELLLEKGDWTMGTMIPFYEDYYSPITGNASVGVSPYVVMARKWATYTSLFLVNLLSQSY